MAEYYGKSAYHERPLFFGLSHDIQWFKQGTLCECPLGGKENLVFLTSFGMGVLCFLFKTSCLIPNDVLWFRLSRETAKFPSSFSHKDRDTSDHSAPSSCDDSKAG